VAADGSPGGNGKNGRPSNGLTDGIPRDPTRFFLWCLTGFLALLGLFFATLNGLPWPHKEAVTQLQRDIARLDKFDDAGAAQRTALELSLQSMQYEARVLKERVDWLEAEIERVKAYIYPLPSYRVPRPRPPGAPEPSPPNVLGPPRTKYP
jgi:hypothetical protein